MAEKRYHFDLRGTTQGPPQETKDLEFAQESLRVKCLRRMWRKVSKNTVFRKTQWWHGGYWKATLKTCCVHWGDGFTPAISGVRANDLEQLMREPFRVRVCERVDPGFLITMEFMHRKVTWNAEDLFWIYDPMYALALADEFGLFGKKQLEQTKSIFCGT